MCGIVAACTQKPINQLLLDNLDRLRYRGYDSAGYALLANDKKLYIAHSTDKKSLQELVQQSHTTPDAHIGIAHTRWSTHGKATIANAHPHFVDDTLALVHNGMIDNYLSVKNALENTHPHITWRSETDSEVIAQWLYYSYKETQDITVSLEKLQTIIQGTYALVIMHKDYPESLFCLCQGTPLTLGTNPDGYFIASDIEAFSQQCEQFHDVKPNTIYQITQQGIHPCKNIEITWQTVPQTHFEITQQANYAHKTCQEIHSQPYVLERLLVDMERDSEAFSQIKPLLEACEHITILGCGSSFYCGRAARYWLESLAQKPTSIELASEFMDSKPCLPKNSLIIVISQSGETQDTISALRYIETHQLDKITLTLPNKTNTPQTIIGSICIGNRPTSTLAKTTTVFLPTYAGQEVGVATTKVFTSQLLRLAQLTYLACPPNPSAQSLYAACTSLPKLVKQTLTLDNYLNDFTQSLCNEKHLLFLGKGPLYPIAEETALKVQELAYIHAQAFASGEIKHGPLALVDENQWVFILLNDDENFLRVLSNINVIAANSGKIVLVGNKDCIDKVDPKLYQKTIELPQASPEITPFIAIVAMQLFSYHLARHKGCSIDIPRGLAKCVSV